MSPATDHLRKLLNHGADPNDLRIALEAVAMEESTALEMFAAASSELKRWPAPLIRDHV